MEPQYHCQLPGRVAEVRKQGLLNGIEFLEVASADQMTLKVHFVLPLPDTGAPGEVPPGGTKLTQANLRIDGGVRITGIQVTDAQTAGPVLTVQTDTRGDFSTYTLRLVTSDISDAVPPGYDPRLASIDFSFKAACPSDFDCQEVSQCPAEEFTEPAIPYLAKDYGSFRRLMLDRLSVLLPDWTDRTPADPLVTYVEALAYAADHLSYWQDAVATEAYLGTARRRISLRRHARLVDYRMHDGCNARTWVHFTFRGTAGKILPAGAVVLTRGNDTTVVLASDPTLQDALRQKPTAFATLHGITLDPAHNEIAFYTWSDAQCCLPRGATRATLKNDPPLSLEAGDWLLFEEVYGPETGVAADADPTHRQVVRITSAQAGTDLLNGRPILEVTWDPADALTFPLCLTTPPGAAAGASVSVARGNLALADHGLATGPETMALEPVAPDRPPRAQLAQPEVTFAAVFDPLVFAAEAQELAVPPEQRVLKTFLTASGAMSTSPAHAVPAVQLELEGQLWVAQRELLASDRYAPEFVVEVENDGTAKLRFGDGVYGLRPPDGAEFTARYRVGNGRAGNVGIDTLSRVRTDVAGIVAVRNPLPAVGGVDRESADSARQYAPQAFRTQERAVTTADWSEVAQRYPGVQRAAAQFRWTGSWHTVFVTVDRRGGLPVETDPAFLTGFRQHLEQFRLAGYDLEINGPIYVPVDVQMTVCVRPGYFRSNVAEALLDLFRAGLRADGSRGFFHPDNFTFGQAVHLSRIYEAAMGVPGVNYVEVTRFQRYGKVPAGELAAGMIPMATLEVARCDSDANFPENGRFQVEPEGGL